jgi:hypothetical protein
MIYSYKSNTNFNINYPVHLVISGHEFLHSSHWSWKRPARDASAAVEFCWLVNEIARQNLPTRSVWSCLSTLRKHGSMSFIFVPSSKNFHPTSSRAATVYQQRALPFTSPHSDSTTFYLKSRMLMIMIPCPLSFKTKFTEGL